MSDDFALSARFFDPDDEYFVDDSRSLPHWAQSGTVCFITWRTWDSMPQDVLNQWLAVRDLWLKQHGIDPARLDWRDQVPRLASHLREAFRTIISERWEASLDAGHGACVLRELARAKLVADSLRHFDGDRYALFDFVVMPNHVHVLVAFRTAEQMLSQCDSWKHYTAVQLNRSLGRKGSFWEYDGFDHLVRNETSFDHYRSYIARNGERAGLGQDEYLYYSKQLK